MIRLGALEPHGFPWLLAPCRKPNPIFVVFTLCNLQSVKVQQLLYKSMIDLDLVKEIAT